MFASHFVAQTTLLGDALLPQSPCKTRSKRSRFEPKKRREMCPFGLFFWQDQAVFFVVGVETIGYLYAVFFRLLVRKKRGLFKINLSPTCKFIF